MIPDSMTRETSINPHEAIGNPFEVDTSRTGTSESGERPFATLGRSKQNGVVLIGIIIAALVAIFLLDVIFEGSGTGESQGQAVIVPATSTTTFVSTTTVTTATTSATTATTTTEATTATTSTTATTTVFVYMCTGNGKCGEVPTKRWAISPKTLANQVGDWSPDNPPKGMPLHASQKVLQWWKNAPPTFKGHTVFLRDISKFVHELLSSDPFAMGDDVPYTQFAWMYPEMVVAITQRQLAFIVANVIMGNKVIGDDGEPDGLSAAMTRCAGAHPAGYPNGPWVKSLLSFLAVLSVELADGGHGTFLIGMNPKGENDDWESRLDTKILNPPQLCNKVKNATSTCQIEEFMTGGTKFQTLTNIAGNNVGGGGRLCHLAQSQDESLVQFYPELFGFSFFTNYMLPVPWTILGSRRYITELSGQSSDGPPFYLSCGKIHETNWLNSEIGQDKTIVDIGVGDEIHKVEMYASSMVSLKSQCAACGHGGACDLDMMKNNRCDYQRRTLDRDIKKWVQSFDKKNYNPAVQDAFGALVKSIGTGPWGSGVWFGDSQMYFLTMWLATSLLDNVVLDYYIYDHFCENPGNQCFVLGANQGNGCADCISTCGVASIDPGNCGTSSAEDMVRAFEGKTARELYTPLSTLPDAKDGTVYDTIQTKTQIVA